MAQRQDRTGIWPWYIVLQGVPRQGVLPSDAVFPVSPGVSLSFTPPGLNLAAGNPTEVRFGQEGNAEDFLVSGWCPPEKDGRWNAGRCAVLIFRPFTTTAANVEATLRFRPFTKPDFPLAPERQRLSIFFNGEALSAEQAVTSADAVRFSIPAVKWNQAGGPTSLATLEFHLPDSVSPAEIDLSGHTSGPHRLGLSFQTLQFQEK